MANYNSSYTGAQIDSAVGRANSTDVTAGTVAASKAVVVDSNKDVTGFRNITGTGTATFANFIGTGDIDIGDASGDTVTITASVDSNIVPSADDTYDLGGSSAQWKDLYVDGTAYIDAIDFNGTAITSTGAELNLIDGGTARGTTAVATGDGILINDAGTMRMTNVDTVSTYFASHNVGGGNIVTTGALDSGSITSGFGTIDTGSSTANFGATTVDSLSVSDGNITNVGDISLDSISSDAGTSINVVLGSDAGDDFTVDTSKLVVEGDTGNVGIGTSSPDHILSLSSTTPRFGMYTEDGGNANERNWMQKINGSAYGSWELIVSDAKGGNPQTAGSTAITVLKDGNVGLGVAAPALNLVVASATNPTFQLADTTTGVLATDGFQLQLADSTAYVYNKENGDMIFGTNNTERMRIDSAGDVTVSTGNLVIGTSGKGIDFSATSDASGMTNELLDDYEEGTWTPTLSFGGGTTGITYNANTSASYTKIGRSVTISAFIQLTNKGSDTGLVKIEGFPFPTQDGHNYATSVSIMISGVSFADFPQMYIYRNASYALFEEITNSGTKTSLDDTNFIDTSWIMASCTYQTT